MNVLGISGSLRAGSHNTLLLENIKHRLQDEDTLTIFSGLGDIPLYSEDIESDNPQTVIALRDAIVNADAIVFATPEYNQAIPGGLKNAIDWISRPAFGLPLKDKPVLVLGSSKGMFGAVWAQAQLRTLLSQALGANVVEEELALGLSDQAFGSEGGIIDESIQSTLEQRLNTLRSEHDKHLLQTA